MNSKLIILILLLLTIQTATAADTVIPTVTVITTINDNSVQITGNAADTSNDINVTAGIQRVELQIDGSSWVTASGTLAYNYTYTNLNNGYHVVGVRSIDNSNNPSDITYKTFLINSETETAIDDLSWYITISDAHFETVDDVFNVRTVTPNTDIRLKFDVNNDADTERKLRYTITRGTFEVTNDIIVRSDSSIEIDEWIVASILSDGTNRFEISVDDWITKEIVAKKDITITVSDSETVLVEAIDNEIPAWFVTVAELNNFSIDQTPDTAEYNEILIRIDKQDELLKVQQQEIKNLQTKIAQSSQSTPSEQPIQQAQIVPGYDNGLVFLLVGAAVIGWYNHKNPGKLWGRREEDQVPEDLEDPTKPLVK